VSRLEQLAREVLSSQLLPNIRDLRITAIREFPKDRQGVSRERLRFLDLGCGVDTLEYRDRHERNYSPRVCIDAANAGWDVTGVDMPTIKNEPSDWKYVQGDLVNTDTLSNIDDNSFDLVHSRLVIGLFHPGEVSPSLILSNGIKPFYEYENSEQLASSNEYIAVIDSIFKLIYRVLRQGGVFILNEKHVFAKSGHLLVPLLKDDDIRVPIELNFESLCANNPGQNTNELAA